MPSLEKHKQQTVINDDFYAETNNKQLEFYDWKITIMFYSILHQVDAVAAKNGFENIRNHKDREAKIKGLLTRNEMDLYFELKSRSRLSRYECTYMDKSKSKTACLYIYKKFYLPLKNALALKI
jgi:hypothetical protein